MSAFGSRAVAATSRRGDPRRRALLIGCPVGGLIGVRNSLRRLGASLRRRLFDIDEERDVLFGDAATHAQILARLDQLVAMARPGDTVVIALLGHGVMVDDPADELDAATRPMVQVFVPSDIDRSARTLTGRELSAALHGLTAKTADVTLILDTCSAAGFLNGLDRPTAPEVVAQDYRVHAEIRRRVAARSSRESLGELADTARSHLDLVVRLVASSTTEQSYQRPGDDGGITLFTDALTHVLDGSLGADRPWSDIMAAVHHRVCSERKDQWVGVEGPRQRLPFSLATQAQPYRSFPCCVNGDAIRVDGGRLHGVRRGAFFLVREPADADGAPGAVITSGTAAEVGATESLITDFDTDQSPPLPPGASAHVARECTDTAIALDVADDVDDTRLIEVLHLLGCSRARSVEDPRLCGRAVVTREAVRIYERRGDSSDEELILEEPTEGPVATAELVTSGLQRLLQWQALSQTHLSRRYADMLDVRWGLLAPDGRQGPPQRPHGERVPAGARLWLRIRASVDMTSPQLHCSVFHVSAARCIRHVTEHEAHGLVVRAGVRSTPPLLAFTSWPRGVPHRGHHHEHVIVLVSPRPLVLHSITPQDEHEAPLRAMREDITRIHLSYELVPV